MGAGIFINVNTELNWSLQTENIWIWLKVEIAYNLVLFA